METALPGGDLADRCKAGNIPHTRKGEWRCDVAYFAVRELTEDPDLAVGRPQGAR